MYKFDLVNCSQKLTAIEIDEVETGIGIKFPQFLRDHYLKFNGGKIEGERCRFIKKVKNKNEIDGFSLHEFYPIKYKVRSKQKLLEEIYRTMVLDQKIIPESYIPIASDVSGWPICCKIDDGAIFLLYREMVDENNNEILVHICDSITELINGMITREDYEDLM